MNPNSQRQMAEFVEANALSTDPVVRVLDLVSEVGELSKELLRGTHYGTTGFRPGEEWVGELGDVPFSLICVANSTGVDLETAMRGALDKYRDRIDSEQDAGSGS